MNISKLTFFLLCVTLFACGGGEGDSSKEPSGGEPIGGGTPTPDGGFYNEIKGDVDFYGLSGSMVAIYDADGNKLGESSLGEAGGFSVRIDNQPPQTLFFSVTGGQYVEPKTGTTIFLTDEKLENYYSFFGDDNSTPLVISIASSLKTALYRYERITKGTSVSTANFVAKNSIDFYTNYPTEETKGKDLSISNTYSSFGDVAKASVFNYGIAQVIGNSLLLSEYDSETQLGSDFTIIHLVSEMYLDLRNDGKLNGVLSSGLASLGGQSLDANTYRHEFAKGMVQFIKSDDNNSNLTVSDVFTFANEISGEAGIFGTLPAVELSTIQPIVNSTSPANNQPIIGEVEFTIDANDFAEITDIGFSFNNTPIVYGSDLSAPSFTIDTSLYSDGAYDVSFFITNIGGQTIEEEFGILISNSGTTISNLDPEENKVVGGTYRFSADVVDPTGINYRKFKIDSNDITGLIATDSGFRKDIDTSIYADGVHSFGVEVTNGIAQTTTDSVSVVFDNTPPSVIWGVNHGDFIDGEAFSVNPSISDTNTIVSANFLFDGDIIAEELHTTPYSLDTSDYAEGDHYLDIVVTDIAGNVINFNKFIKIDNQPPTVDITWPVDGSTISSTSFSVFWEQDDENGWGAVNAKLYVGGTLYGEVANTTESRSVNPYNRDSGWNVVEVVVTDATGKTASSSINLYFDPP